ncbi:ATP-dependent RNA helicase [Entomophthora muscae]|uniref:ATP-dependent RNA helicase n=1 Tax=Entomophthora muscae TaxID=34485 RepID=A0ACC2U9B1_9FUNG|nr:ATP-dependent RNA helicase [Entomophthora muscae]
MAGQDFIHVDDFSEEEPEPEPLPKSKTKTKKPLVLKPEVSKLKEEREALSLESTHENGPEPVKSKQPKEESEDFDLTCLPVTKKKAKKPKVVAKKTEEVVESFVPLPFLQNWSQFDLASPILQAIQKLNFQTPSQIQLEALPHALRHRDIIGCAETGSGKTLAFGLPLIQRLSMLDLTLPENDCLHGLILTPTRELAIQIADHLKAVSQFLRIKISTTVGGMSIQKQERLFNKTPHIMIATPGRLWELMNQNDAYMNKVRGVQYLVLDEADRMVEKGHFKELEFILDHLNRTKVSDDPSEKVFKRRQTLVFSATLDNYLEQSTKHKHSQSKNTSTIDSILERIRFKDPKPMRIDLSSKKLTSENLVERRIDCVNAEKDLFLYFLVTRYPGRTLVFVNSIDTIRRLVPLLVLLGVNAFPLHAQMQQRQRLKNVDRFKSLDSSVLIASDVASRGLDIPGVEHIIHYQLARTPDLYVHRSGRTARAQRQGISIMLCSPDELKSYRATCRALKRTSIPEFPFDSILAAKLAPRIALAKKIDSLQHRLDKESTEKNWFIKNAEAMEIELDDYYKDSDSEEETQGSIAKQKRQKVAALKAELKQMMSTDVLPLGVSSYLTQGVHSQFASSLSQGPFRGVAASHAIDDAQKARKNKC